jgi:hypothetical protein
MASREFSYIPKVICAAWNATIIMFLLNIFSSLTITCCPSKRPSKHQLDPVLCSIGKWLIQDVYELEGPYEFRK